MYNKEILKNEMQVITYQNNNMHSINMSFYFKVGVEYEIKEKRIVANVNADKILDMLYYFIDANEGLYFLIIEIPTRTNEEGKIKKYRSKYEKEKFKINFDCHFKYNNVIIVLTLLQIITSNDNISEK